MATLHMYSKIKSIWAPSAIYKINKGTQTEQSHEIQLKQYQSTTIYRVKFYTELFYSIVPTLKYVG